MSKPWILSIRNLVFSGGGQKGNAFLGALKVLEEIWNFCGKETLFSQIEGYGGSSIGALVALGCAMQMSVQELREWFMCQDTKEIITQSLENLTQLYSHGGLLKSEIIREKVENLMKYCFPEDPKKISFLTFYKKTGKNLKVVTSNLSRGTLEIFDYQTTPNASVADTITISMNIPFWMQPFFYNGQWYSDGGLYDNFPITMFPSDSVLGFRVRGTNLLPLKFSFQEYVMCITVNTMDFYEDQILKCLSSEYQERTMTIQFPPSTFIEMINADKTKKEEYIRLGEQSMINYLFREFFMGQMLLWMLAEMQPHGEKADSIKNEE